MRYPRISRLSRFALLAWKPGTRWLWLVCCGLLLARSEACLAGQGARPNILFLFADDQRADALEAWGNRHIKTPHLNQLVEQGFSFRNNYCFGSNSPAVCMPSRVMVHTGKRWLDVDQQMTGQVTLGELLRQHGYTTFATGKWHNGKPSLVRSFTRGKHLFLGGMCDHTRVPLSEIVEGEVVARGIGPKFSSELFADAALEFLQEQPAEEPFFAYVSFTAPHDPRNPLAAYREMYYSSPPPLPGNFLPQHPFDLGGMTIRDEQLAPWPRPEKMVQDQLCEYYGLITHMDEQIGRILKGLAHSGHAQNTIVVYAADHGLALGSHGLLGKQSLYEHSMKCPLILTGPGIPAGRETQAFSYLYDIYPTLCALCGVEPPADLAGFDLSAIWRGGTGSVRETVFLPYMETQRSVRQGRWKLIVYPQINHRQLFDLETDPGERVNLAELPEQAERLAGMWRLLEAEQQSAGDQQTLTSRNPKPREIDLTGQARQPDAHQPGWIVEKYFGRPRP